MSFVITIQGSLPTGSSRMGEGSSHRWRITLCYYDAMGSGRRIGIFFAGNSGDICVPVAITGLAQMRVLDLRAAGAAGGEDDNY